MITLTSTRYYVMNNMGLDSTGHVRLNLTKLVATVNDLAEALNKGTRVDVILLDLAKAFDTVPHTRLVHRLRSYGINGQLLRWIESFLMNRSQQVTVNCQLSSTAQVISGVLQGSVLGPLFVM